MPKKIYPYENVILPWERNNVLKGIVPNKPGVYFFYGPQGQLLYTGHAKRMRHRLQSYYQEDCFREHPTKSQLRQHIEYVRWDLMPEQQARIKEKKVKQHALFNFK